MGGSPAYPGFGFLQRPRRFCFFDQTLLLFHVLLLLAAPRAPPLLIAHSLEAFDVMVFSAAFVSSAFFQ